jgi:hypothetical protein
MRLQIAYLQNRLRELREQLLYLRDDPGSAWWRLGVILDRLAMTETAADLLVQAAREENKADEQSENERPAGGTADPDPGAGGGG